MGRKAPRFSRERWASEMIAACAAFGANAPNGAGDGSLSGVKQKSSVKRRMHSRFCGGETGSIVGGFDSHIANHAEHPGDSPAVIASEAKQSTLRHLESMDCFVASFLAMTARYGFAFSRHKGAN
jgi:hypothetical protein